MKTQQDMVKAMKNNETLSDLEVAAGGANWLTNAIAELDRNHTAFPEIISYISEPIEGQQSVVALIIVGDSRISELGQQVVAEAEKLLDEL